MDIAEAKAKLDQIRGNINLAVVGKDDVVRKVLICLIAGGHVLLEDVPGTGKTILAKSLSKSIAANFSRIQFTPDLLPADITGINIYNRAEEAFQFVPGPIMANILLADEINRATPRTQSALLEAMQEGQVTVDGETRTLSAPFFVIATENPVETAGTFPLPEAELDRFMMQLSVGSLTAEEEMQMLRRYENAEPSATLDAVAAGEDILSIRTLLEQIKVHDDLLAYIATISAESRKDNGIYMGVSPRGSLLLLKAAKASALLDGRDYVLPDDIKSLVLPVFLHRILFVNRRDKASKEEYLNALLNRIEVPSEDFSVL
ncbi:MAG: MoxR family ATPase [Lachnospiraceae bacterium]|nr:MoxR family ATPase [Lachnospiraceae bacterium]